MFTDGRGSRSDPPSRPARRGIATYLVGQSSEAAEAFRQELLTRARTSHVQPFWLALIAVASGRIDEAFALPRRLAEEHDTLAPLTRLWPDWAPYRSDPRFLEAQRMLGFAEKD